MLALYADESYNNRTICMGGWLASSEVWKSIERKWLERIAYENRISSRKNLKPISRYHAADCASLQNEFAGWTVERQIRFSKRLIRIISEHKPSGVWGLAWGASLEDFAGLFPSAAKHQLRKGCYKICVYECLKEVRLVMQNCFPHEKVTIFHDSGGLVTAAQEVFETFTDCRDQFVSLAPLHKDQCVALQPADLMAYEGMRLSDKRLQGQDAVRRSLGKIVQGIPLTAGYVKRGAFQEVFSQINAGEFVDHPPPISVLARQPRPLPR